MSKERLEKLQLHIRENPSDYQSVISFFKLRSKEIEYERKQEQIKRLKLIAECRRKLNGEQLPESRS